jgi:hypothetical protein
MSQAYGIYNISWEKSNRKAQLGKHLPILGAASSIWTVGITGRSAVILESSAYSLLVSLQCLQNHTAHQLVEEYRRLQEALERSRHTRRCSQHRSVYHTVSDTWYEVFTTTYAASFPHHPYCCHPVSQCLQPSNQNILSNTHRYTPCWTGHRLYCRWQDHTLRLSRMVHLASELSEDRLGRSSGLFQWVHICYGSAEA